MRVVLDTNVIVSGLLIAGSPADLIRQAWDAQRFTLVTSKWQLDELRRVSHYPHLKKHLSKPEVGRLINRIRSHAEVLESLPSIEASPDPDDNPILATAITGKADWLVTGDKNDLLALQKVEGVRIITARQLVQLLG